MNCVCPRCNKRNPASNAFCKWCGASLEAAHSPANQKLQRLRKNVDKSFATHTLSCEKASTEEAIESCSVYVTDKLLPYVTAETKHVYGLLDQKRHEYGDCIQFFESDYIAVIDSVSEARRRMAATRPLVEKLEERTEAGGWFGRARRERLLNRLHAALKRTSESSPDTRLIVEKVRQVVTAIRATLEREVAAGLSLLGEANAHYWIAFSLFIEDTIEQSCRPSPNRELWDLTSRITGSDLSFMKEHERLSTMSSGLSDIRTAISTKHFASKKYRSSQPPMRLAVKQLQRHLRANPDSIEGWELMVSALNILGRTDALYKADIELRRARATAVSSTAQQPQSEVPPDGAGISFELRCRRLLEAVGFDASVTEATADGGIDIIATRSGPITSGRYIVQCKDWQSNVGVKIARELYGVVVAEDANKGILITSSGFTSSAIAFAEGKRLDLIDGEALQRLFSKYVQASLQERR